jgi:hypothetical protein
MSGLWELDHAQFERAIEYLSDPCLTPTFSDEILLTLIRHSRCDSALASAYFTAVSPPLKDSKTLDAYFELLVKNSLVEAYYFAQKQQESVHKQLFERLVIAVHKDKADQGRAQKAVMLVGLPLSPQEELWLEECLTKGSASEFSGARDTLLARRIALGNSIKDVAGKAESGLAAPNVRGFNWERIIQEGIA